MQIICARGYANSPAEDYTQRGTMVFEAKRGSISPSWVWERFTVKLINGKNVSLKPYGDPKIKRSGCSLNG
jgi:hypothetical protein